MTVKYAIKKCNSIGFARNLNEALSLFDDNELKNGYQIVESFDNLMNGIILVHLGEEREELVKCPKEFDEVDTILELELSEDIEGLRDTLLAIFDNPDNFIDTKLTDDLLKVILGNFSKFSDTKFKQTLISILANNNFNTLELESKYPIEYVDEIRKVVVNTKLFQDIKIVTNNKDSNKTNVKYRNNEHISQTMKDSTQLEAFSKNKFTVIHGRKSANIQSLNVLQNHDVLNSLARNGVVCSPNTKEELSIHKLMRSLGKLDSFDIIAIHPLYELKGMRSEIIGEQIEPAYLLQGGEILAVFYRYIVKHFFGYCSTYEENTKEWKYYI
jgi:hypothetical protein